MIPSEIHKIKSLLDSFLGESKYDLSDSYQLEYPCPRCVEKYGRNESLKYNLSVNLRKQMFQCWKCVSEDDDMHGSITKLIKLYGNENILNEYRQCIKELRESSLYKLSFNEDDFNVDYKQAVKEELSFPKTFKRLIKDNYGNNKRALSYLKERGIGWDIIERFGIGYTRYDSEKPYLSNRIIIPSHDKFGDLNYWTGRDFSGKAKQKYYNPNVERKDIIFDEDMVQWDADITLVEGPFDHIVVPNSIPLLGKALDRDYKLYWELVTRANAHVNIWLDNDAQTTAKVVYSLLNHGRLNGKIRMVEYGSDKDPSEIYEKLGPRGIIKCLQNVKKIPECELFF